MARKQEKQRNIDQSTDPDFLLPPPSVHNAAARAFASESSDFLHFVGQLFHRGRTEIGVSIRHIARMMTEDGIPTTDNVLRGIEQLGLPGRDRAGEVRPNHLVVSYLGELFYGTTDVYSLYRTSAREPSTETALLKEDELLRIFRALPEDAQQRVLYLANMERAMAVVHEQDKRIVDKNVSAFPERQPTQEELEAVRLVAEQSSREAIAQLDEATEVFKRNRQAQRETHAKQKGAS